jgi:hypothetical protein
MAELAHRLPKDRLISWTEWRMTDKKKADGHACKRFFSAVAFAE